MTALALRRHSTAKIRPHERPALPLPAFGQRLSNQSTKLAPTMLRRPIHRLTTAFIVVVSLLFSQLALASYVCPAEAGDGAMARMMASGAPCSGMDEAQPVLCHQHAAGAAQSAEAVKLPVLTLPTLFQVLVLPAVFDLAEHVANPAWNAVEARPQPAPVFLATLRLRV